MKVGNLAFEKIQKDERIYLKISGSILNPLEQAEILPPLKISVWTACAKNSISSSLSTGVPYCVAKAWEHKFEDPSIQAGAQKDFVSVHDISDVEDKILKIEAAFS